MKYFICFLLMASAMIHAMYAQEILNFDKKASELIWTGYAAVGSYSMSGNVSIKEAELQVKDDQIVDGNMSINMKTIKHNNRELEKHLKTENFFAVKEFPDAKFVLKTPIPYKSGIYEVKGDLTLKGITREVASQLECEVTDTGVRIQGKFEVNRTSFDITYLSLSFFKDAGEYAISDKFDLRYDVNFAK